MNDELLRYEIRRLAGKIQEVIFKQQISEDGVNATEKEVWSRVDEIFSKAGVTDKKAKEIAESSRIIYAALLEWHKDPNKADDIYEKMLKSVITKDQWRLYQACFDTPEKLRRFAMPDNIEDKKEQLRISQDGYFVSEAKRYYYGGCKGIRAGNRICLPRRIWSLG